MIIMVCDDYQRLHLNGTSSECAREVEKPWDVTIFRSVTSRSPIMARFRTLDDAVLFVNQVTNQSAHRWVQNGTNPAFSFQAFTGSHCDRYLDHAQYKPIPERVWNKARSLYQAQTSIGNYKQIPPVNLGRIVAGDDDENPLNLSI